MKTHKISELYLSLSQLFFLHASCPPVGRAWLSLLQDSLFFILAAPFCFPFFLWTIENSLLAQRCSVTFFSFHFLLLSFLKNSKHKLFSNGDSVTTESCEGGDIRHCQQLFPHSSCLWGFPNGPSFSAHVSGAIFFFTEYLQGKSRVCPEIITIDLKWNYWA